MHALYPFTLHGQSLVFSPLSVVFWKEAKTLIIADLHLGKIAALQHQHETVPYDIIERDLLKISDLIFQFHPKFIIVLGDLFHSGIKNDLFYFELWRKQFADVHIDLVLGKHDTLPYETYQSLGIEPHIDAMEKGPFLFAHKPLEEPQDKLIICGHVHPAIRIYDEERQFVKFPCFYIGTSHVILPAFNLHAGSSVIAPSQEDTILAVTNVGIRPIS